MFPSYKVKVTGMNPKTKYILLIDIVPATTTGTNSVTINGKTTLLFAFFSIGKLQLDQPSVMQA